MPELAGKRRLEQRLQGSPMQSVIVRNAAFMDRQEELLERIAAEYPKTGAAKKARHILHLPEPEEEKAAPAAEAPEPVEEADETEEKVFDLDEMIAATDEETAAPPLQAAPETPSPAQPPKPKLPPGFRKKE